jgi:hypothetical protein
MFENVKPLIAGRGLRQVGAAHLTIWRASARDFNAGKAQFRADDVHATPTRISCLHIEQGGGLATASDEISGLQRFRPSSAGAAAMIPAVTRG